MSRLQAVDPATATGKAKELLDAVKGKMGMVPNMTKMMAASLSVLKAYLDFSEDLSGGLLDAKTGERIALLAAQENQCNYCLSAHSALGKISGLSAEEIAASRKGTGGDAKTTAALAFAKRVLDTKGQVNDADLSTVRNAGFSDGQIAEIIAHVALNVFTNYFNVATEVEIDFPKVSHSDAA